jgi:hypothetical protein
VIEQNTPENASTEIKLTRAEVLDIAKLYNMEYVHETFLIRFVEHIIHAESVKNVN